MLVFTMSFGLLRELVRNYQGQYFYLDAGDTIEIFSPTREAIMLRAVYKKKAIVLSEKISLIS